MRFSSATNFLISALFLGGLLNSGMCFAHETAKHNAELHHHHHHHAKLRHVSHHHGHVAQEHHIQPNVSHIAEKSDVTHEEGKIQPNKPLENHELKTRTIVKVADTKH